MEVGAKVMRTYRVFQKSVPDPSSSGAAKYYEVSIYPKVAAIYRFHKKTIIHIMV